MGRIWDDGAEISPSQLEELMARMGLNQSELADLLELSQPHVNALIRGRKTVTYGSTRVLLRWLFAVHGIEGGRPAHPRIPVVIPTGMKK